MTMSAEDDRPASQQLAAVIRAEIRSGKLEPGAKVLSIRDLAKKYGVAPMTAQTAVEILRAENLVYTSPGRGSFVRDPLPAEDEQQHSPEYLAITKHLNAMESQISDLARRLAELEELTAGQVPSE